MVFKLRRTSFEEHLTHSYSAFNMFTNKLDLVFQNFSICCYQEFVRSVHKCYPFLTPVFKNDIHVYIAVNLLSVDVLIEFLHPVDRGRVLLGGASIEVHHIVVRAGSKELDCAHHVTEKTQVK